jgi:hypothetical protein
VLGYIRIEAFLANIISYGYTTCQPWECDISASSSEAGKNLNILQGDISLFFIEECNSHTDDAENYLKHVDIF